MNIRRSLIKSCVQSLQWEGFAANEENIFTNDTFKVFFIAMLKENKGWFDSADPIIDQLLKELE